MKQFFSFMFLTISIVFNFSSFVRCTWNFSSVGLPDDVPIWRFAVWRNRAFLAIPSFAKREKSIDGELTLLEVSWPEPGHHYSTFILPNANNAVRVFPKWAKNMTNECERLSSVVGLDVDNRGRFWVLDSPDRSDCPAKIVIYDIRRGDVEILRSDLRGVPKNNLRTLVIDPIHGFWGPRAYIGDPGDETIIVWSLFQKRWWKLKLVRDKNVPPIAATEMAISRKNSLLYLTDPRSQDLFSVDLETSRNDEGPPVVTDDDIGQNGTVKWLGSKMGSSSGLACDYKGGLHYFLVTEHASVRWDTKHDLKTNTHSVLLQNEEVPCITDYRFDLPRNIWGLVNLEHPFAKSRSSIYRGKWNATLRTVRVYKSPLFP